MSRSRGEIALLVLMLAWYLIGAVPFLADYPIPGWDEMGIAAPAHALATRGVYGNPLFTGFHGSEVRNYEYMPAYPLLVAGSFALFGLGLFQARMVSVVCGLLIIVLTYRLGCRLHGGITGLLAAGFLTIVRLSPAPGRSGITLIDFARIVRYDLLAPVFVLGASLLFVRARIGGRSLGPAHRSRPLYLGAGVLAGLATLSQLYGAFVLPVFAVLTAWVPGSGKRRVGPLLLVLSGWIMALVPWVVYVLQDVAGYLGQMSRHEGRFDLLRAGFYWDNLTRETARYAAWVGGFPEGLLLPRLGLWVLAVGVAASWPLLWRRSREPDGWSARFSLVALPVIAVQLALLLSLKRHVYTLVLLPFIAIQVGVSVTAAATRIRRSSRRALRFAAGCLVLLTVAEGAAGVWSLIDRAHGVTPYREITTRLDQGLPSTARLLVSQPFWMGLAHHPSRSVNLPFVQAASRPQWRTSERAPVQAFRRSLDRIDFDHVVLERFWIDETVAGRRGSGDERTRLLWRTLAAWLDDECARVVATVRDPDYGIVDVRACE